MLLSLLLLYFALMTEQQEVRLKNAPGKLDIQKHALKMLKEVAFNYSTVQA